jgi:hypothetical protein
MSSRLLAVSDLPTTGEGAEVILPCQYFELAAGDSKTGEERLMFALLVDAINVYQRGAMSSAPRARRLYVEAEQWIMDHRGSCGWLSFNTVCEAVGIDAGLLRRRLLDWKHTIRHRLALQSRIQMKISPRLRNSAYRRARRPLRPFIPM